MEYLKKESGKAHRIKDGDTVYVVDADSRAEAEAIVQARSSEKAQKEANRDYKAEMRKELTSNIKIRAQQLLTATTDDVLQYLEEEKRGQGTTKSNEEIQLILDNRASIRQQRDDMIASLPELKSIGKLEKFKIEFNV